MVQSLNQIAEKSESLKQQDHSTPIKSKNSLLSAVDDHSDDDDYDEESETSQKSDLHLDFMTPRKIYHQRFTMLCIRLNTNTFDRKIVQVSPLLLL